MRLVTLLILLTTSCLAQQILKVGLSLSQTTQTPPYGSVHRRVAGFVTGIAIHRQWTERTAVRPELLFIQKGDRLTTSAEELRMRTNYFEIPVVVVLSLMKGQHPVMLSLVAGPSFGYGLGGKYKLDSPGTPQQGGVIFGEADPTVATQAIYLENPVDIGVQLGGQVTVKERVLVEIRYGIGFISQDDPPDPLPAGRTSSDFEMKNGVLQFAVGWVIKN